MKQLSLIIATTALIVTGNSYAQQSHQGMNMDGMKMDMPAPTSNTNTLAIGEVKAVNKDNQSITLKHGPIKSSTVQMSPMTMTFAVKDVSMITDVKTGDRVKFNVENVKGVATVTVLSAQK